MGAVFFLVALMLMPTSRFIRESMPSKFQFGRSGEAEVTPVDVEPAPPFNLTHAVNGLAVSLVICAVSFALTALVQLESLFILAVTLLSLLVANLSKPVTRHVASEFELGTLFMYIFFVCIGAGADIAEVMGAALPILLFILVMVLVHLVILVGVGRLMRLDLAEVMIASNACILGPAPAAALAASRGWQPLVAPGILVGLLGYAIATLIGVAMTALLRS